MRKIAIIGQGYVGLTIAMYASEFFKVIGFDTNKKLVDSINQGRSHIEGITESRLIEALKSGKYMASEDPTEINGSEVVVIAVPTPLDSERKPDLSYIDKACEIIGNNLTDSALIINESTSFPGTLRNYIKPRVEKNLHNSQIRLSYASSPERVDPGQSEWNQINTPRLFAGLDPKATKLTRDFYGLFCTKLIEVTTPEVAEAAKLFENTFRQVNIALVNEFAQIAHTLGISVRETLEAANTKPFGFMKFNPSAGVGGHCIPVDPTYLAMVAKNNGAQADFIELANKVNLDMAKYIVKRIKNDNGGNLTNKKIQIVGVAYKPNVSDVRETPAEQIYNQLVQEGCFVSWYDPLVSSWIDTKSDSNLGSDLGVVVTPHDCIVKEDIRSKFNYLFDTSGLIYSATQL